MHKIFIFLLNLIGEIKTVLYKGGIKFTDREEERTRKKRGGINKTWTYKGSERIPQGIIYIINLQNKNNQKEVYFVQRRNVL